MQLIKQATTELSHPHADLFGYKKPLPLDELIRLKKEKGLRIAVVLPAHNEGKTIGRIIDTWRDLRGQLWDEMLVIDSESVDNTSEETKSRGVTFHDSREMLQRFGIAEASGKGTNVWLSQFLTDADLYAIVDADMQNPSNETLHHLLSPLIEDDNLMLSKSIFHRDTTVASGDTATGGRVTQLTVNPLINMLFPELHGILQPLNGNIAVRRSALETISIGTDYQVDLQVLIGIALQHGIDSIAQVHCGVFKQEGKELNQLAHIAHQHTRLLFDLAEQEGRIVLPGEKPKSYTQYKVNGHTQKEERLYKTEALPAAVSIPDYSERFATDVSLMRHGPTQWNTEARIQGQEDIPIIPEKITGYLESLHYKELVEPNVIVVSELLRAEETAKALRNLRGWNVPIVKSPYFNERAWGILEGKTRDEARYIYPDIDLVIDSPTFKASQGESLEEVNTRAVEGLSELRRLYPGKRILLVCHSGVLLSLGKKTSEVSLLTVSREQDGAYTVQ